MLNFPYINNKCKLLLKWLFGSYYPRQSNLYVWWRNYIYNFEKYLRNKNVLEVGANRGKLFKQYFNIEKSHFLLEPSYDFVENYLLLKKEYSNVDYQIDKFESFKTDNMFNVIILCAVLTQIKLPPNKIFEKVNSMLSKDGILIVESNFTRSGNKFNQFIKNITKKYKIIEQKTYCEIPFFMDRHVIICSKLLD